MNNEEAIKNEEIIRIEEIIGILKKRWKMIVAITMIATIIAGAVSFFLIPPKYEASTKVFIGKQDDIKNENYDNNDVQMYQKLLKTYAEVIMTNDLVEKAIRRENLNVDSEAALKSLTVTPRADTQILEIKYTDTNNELARDLVESITSEFIRYSTDLIPNGNVKVIESVKLPTEPASPNKKLNIAVAFLLGLMVSIGLVFLLEFMDNTFKTKEQLEDILGLPVIGAIPEELN